MPHFGGLIFLSHLLVTGDKELFSSKTKDNLMLNKLWGQTDQPSSS